MESLSGILAFVHAARLRSMWRPARSWASRRRRWASGAAGDGLGVRLLNRSTRRISLTEEGELFLERCARIVRELEEAEAEVTRAGSRRRAGGCASACPPSAIACCAAAARVHPALSRDRAGPGLQRPHRRPDRRGRGRGHAQRQLRRFALKARPAPIASRWWRRRPIWRRAARRARPSIWANTRGWRSAMRAMGNCRNGDSAARRKTPRRRCAPRWPSTMWRRWWRRRGRPGPGLCAGLRRAPIAA